MTTPDTVSEGLAGVEARARAFVRQSVMPNALKWDQSGAIPEEALWDIGRQGFLGLLVPEAFGGLGASSLEYGLMVEMFAYASPSLATLFTVHGMVCRALEQWGTEVQQRAWLPRLAVGDAVGAFCLTEAQAGSDTTAIAAEAVDDGDGIALSGDKLWITFGQFATVLIVFARYKGDPCAFIVPADAEGVYRTPVSGMSGLQAAMLANISFDRVRLSRADMVGRRGAGLSHVASTALAHGRFSVAWSCVGILQACCAEARRHTVTREQFGKRLSGHQLVQQMMAKMHVGLRAARDVCITTAHSLDEGVAGALVDVCIAKYLASVSAAEASRHVVQLQGAEGCKLGAKAQQLQRDAAIMEIIEGTTQILETIIGCSARLDPLIGA